MFSTLSRNWWAFVLRGVIVVLFGLLALLKPGITLEALVVLFGFFAIVDGIFSLVAGISLMGSGAPWGGPLVGGLFSIVIGIGAFVWPGITALSLLYVIAFWSIFRGLVEITAGVQLRDALPHPAMLGFAGALSVVFGLLLVIFPNSGALAVIWLIGLYAIIFGITYIVLGFRLRDMEHKVAAVGQMVQGA